MPKMMKLHIELDKAKVQMLIQNYEKLPYSLARYMLHIHGCTRVWISW